MRKSFYTAKVGNVAVPVYKCTQTKRGKQYVYYSVDDYSDGGRRCQTFSKPADAKKRARDIASALADGQPELLEFAGIQQPIQSAVELLSPTGLRLDEAARLLVDVLQIVNPAELIEACRFWQSQRPKEFTARLFSVAVDEFLAQQLGDISLRRQITNGG